MLARRAKSMIAARLRPFVERVVREQLAALHAATPPLAAEPARKAPASVPVPADLQLLRIAHPTLPGFDIAIAAEPRPYERNILENRYYSEIARLLNAHLGGGGTLVDLGANIGTIALPVAAAGSRVIAVELLPQNVRKLLFATLANGFGHMRVVQAAVSSADALIGYAGDEAWGTVSAGAGAQAVALRLDTILAGIALQSPALLRPPFALKIDVEGHEYQALRGAETFLAEHQPFIVFESIEMGGEADESRTCKTFLVARGYRLFMLRSGLLVPKQPDDVQEELVADFVAVPPGMVTPAGFDVRQPTRDERLAWLREIAGTADVHRQHVIRVAERLGEQDEAFATLAAELAAGPA
jgi:FkbM family methyltransferase